MNGMFVPYNNYDGYMKDYIWAADPDRDNVDVRRRWCYERLAGDLILITQFNDIEDNLYCEPYPKGFEDFDPDEARHIRKKTLCKRLQACGLYEYDEENDMVVPVCA